MKRRDLNELAEEYERQHIDDQPEALMARELFTFFEEADRKDVCQAFIKCWNAAFMAGMHYQKDHATL